MKRFNAIHALGMLLFVAAYSASTKSAHSGGYIDAGTTVGNPLGTGFGYQGGLCGMSCAGSGFSSQYNGLPSGLPKQIIQHQVPVMPNIQGGWVNGGGGYPGGGYPGGGYPGGGYPGGGYPGGGYPGGGYPGGGYPGGGYPCGFNPCANNNFYPPMYAPLPNMSIPGGPCNGCGMTRGPAYAQGGGGGGYIQGGGTTIIDMRSPAEWEKNDTAGIIWGVSAGLSSMTSNVYPVAFQRQDITIPPGISHHGDRTTGFEPRPGLQHGGSIFQ